MSNIIGIRNNNTIVPYSAATKRTKQVDLSLSCSQGGWAGSYAKGVIYRDSSGNWRIAFNIAGTFTAANLSTLQVSIDNIKPSAIQSISAFFSGATVLGTTQSYIETSGTSGRITLLSTSSNTNVSGIYASGDIALSEEPTTYTTAANMEGVIAADVWIPPANSTTPGLLNYYEEGSFTVYFIDGTNKSSDSTVNYTRIGNRVTVEFISPPFFTSAGSGFISITTTDSANTYTWPANLIPTYAQLFVARMYVAGAASNQPGMIQFAGGTNGVPILYKDLTPNSWANASNGLSGNQTFTYLI